MLFNSYQFIFFFLPVTFFGYFYLNKKRLTITSQWFLLFSSLFFYSWWNVGYLALILWSVCSNYMIGKILQQAYPRFNIHKKIVLILGISLNLSLLLYFKYADFFIANTNYVFGSKFPELDMILPLAISFFTFQQIAYLYDCYCGEADEYIFVNYAVFVCFFPQLIAGPIVHHKEMMPQFSMLGNKVVNYRNIAIGLFLFSTGLLKKVLVADTFAQWATHGFDGTGLLSFLDAWTTSLAYTFQIYFDFSGYTDMAIGAALLFNIRLPINFNSPYQAVTIQEFWRRWHITLSRFFRDYIYIPLGGNRKGKFRVLFNLMITFLLCGLWHGAGWTFVFWGFLHGSVLIVCRLWNLTGMKLNRFVAWFLTFNFVNIAWIFFRAKEWEDAIRLLKAMGGFDTIWFSKSFILMFENIFQKFSLFVPDVLMLKGIGITQASKPLIAIAVGFIIVLAVPNMQQRMQYPRFSNASKTLTLKNAVLFSSFFLLGLLVMGMSTYSEFIYFNF